MSQIAQKYILYARKSTESDDKQAASIESQLREMIPIAKERGIHIVDTIKESCSGYKTGRNGFKLLMQKVESGEVDGIICWSLSRLARNPLDAGQVMQHLFSGKIKHVVTYKKDYYPTDSSMLLYVEFGINNQYSQDLSIDTLRGLRQKAGRGWNPQATLPLGYIHNPNERLRKFSDKEIIEEPERFELVKLMFKSILDEGLTPPEAMDKVRMLGLTTRKGEVPSNSVLYRMLNNPFYYGEFSYPKNGEIFQGRQKKMLTREEFQKVQEIIHRRNPSRVSKHQHDYGGLFTCANCGCAITGDPERIKILKNGNNSRYKYYHCTHKRGKCEGKYATEEFLKTQIIADLKRFFIPVEILEIIKEEISDCEQKDSKTSDFEHKLKEKQISKLEIQKERLLDLYLSGNVSENEYKLKKNKIEKDILDLDNSNKAGEIEKQTVLPPVIDIDKFESLDIRVRKKLLKDIYQKMSYYNGNINLIHDPLLDVFYNVPSEITSEYYQVRTKINVGMKGFIREKVQFNNTWGALVDIIVNLGNGEIKKLELAFGRFESFFSNYNQISY